MKHHGITYCCHCLDVPAVRFHLCYGCIRRLQEATTAALVARIAVQRDPYAILCKACADSACTLSDGLCPGCRRAIAA